MGPKREEKSYYYAVEARANSIRASVSKKRKKRKTTSECLDAIGREECVKRQRRRLGQ